MSLNDQLHRNDVRHSVDDEEKQSGVTRAMTMQQAQQMIQRVFNSGGIL